MRRATFDLTGLPPSAEEIDAFVADTSPDAFPKLVDRLLDSPHYGEHWGRHWLDVVRYADTAGETADYPVPFAWRYRNYVINAFNADKPYNEFLQEQIAGDLLAKRGPRERYAERVTATGYLAISRRFGFDSENYHHLTIQDTIDTLGQSVLGLTLGCARCHDHKFDPVPMTDYYALYGIFESTRYAFPGSEQKPKTRALVPLLPPEESQPRWREFESRAAALVRKLERAKHAPPTAVLRSLDDMDGDFELQAPAAGGSKGVLVPPWVYDGPIAVTTDAQSPFTNLHPVGRVGASVAAGTNRYRIMQALPEQRTGSDARLHASLDFRIGATDNAVNAPHRFWFGASDGSPVMEILLTGEAVKLTRGDSVQLLGKLRPNEWYQLQLAMDFTAGTFTGSIGRPGEVTEFGPLPLNGAGSRNVGAFGLDSSESTGGFRAAIAVDNLAVQIEPLPPVSIGPMALAKSDETDATVLNTQLLQLAGEDGDFELQSESERPTAPWGPGPNSMVRISAAAQSPFRNLYPAGQLGIHLPNRAAYDGFDRQLTNRWQAGKSRRLFASFDFRCADATAGGEGSWRFYVGHGAGGSPAVELFFNRRDFFRRSAEARDAVRPLRVGEWYQVQLALDLKARNYTGVIASVSDHTEFAGEFAGGWDGSIDFTFIDSYGHIAGVRPALDADNFVFTEIPLPPPDAKPIQFGADEVNDRRAKVAGIRRQLAAVKTGSDLARQELESLLIEGPFPLAYAVSEGTPRNARLQLRGDPDKPGGEVPRGLLQVLGGGPLKPDTHDSGRLELADWLTSPANPLTARVMVNRLWQHHFGQGLVKTPNDFGLRGQPPTHPELLDHLAAEFIRSGWSIKAMHRLIMASAVYQQRSQYSVISNQSSVVSASDDCPVIPGTSRTGQLNTDLLNTDYFSPYTRRRLGAEETRDAILLVSGELDPTPGEGHPFPAPTGWGYSQHGPFNAVYDHNRRSVYLMAQRLQRHPFLALFDGADPNASTAERRTTTVPTQALFFLNDPFVHASAGKFAARMLANGDSEPQRITAAYRRVLGRIPTSAESTEAAEFLAAYRAELSAANNSGAEPAAWAALARVLFGSNEFLTVD